MISRFRARLFSAHALALVLTACSTMSPLLARTLNVGVSGSPPFVQKTETSFNGISVEVWEAIAAENNYNYKLIGIPTPDQGIQAIIDGNIDILIGPISITEARLKLPEINFTQPYFFARAGVMLPTTPPTLFSRARVFFRRAVLSSLLVLISVLFVVGTLIWLAERRRNVECFPHKPLPGIGCGMWFALVTLTTVGYGDKAPITRTGRFITASWMIFSLIAVSSLTAGFASAFTLFLTNASESPITAAEDLVNKPVAVIKGTSGLTIAEAGMMQPVIASDLPTAIENLRNNSVYAVIFDRPELRYYLKHNPDLKKDLAIAPFSLTEETYGFAFRTNSPLDLPLDLSILRLQRDGILDTITNKVLE